MQRHEFQILLGFAAEGWPCCPRAQQEEIATIGILVIGNPAPEEFLKGFCEGFREADLTEGRHVPLEIRSTEGKRALVSERAAKMLLDKRKTLAEMLGRIGSWMNGNGRLR